MSNVFLNANEYSNTMLLMLKNQLRYGRLVDGSFRDEVDDGNGLLINIKRPPQFVTTSGPTLQSQFVITGSTSVSVNQYRGVHLGIGDLERIQSYNDLMANASMKQAASALAHYIDSQIGLQTLRFYGSVGTFGQPIRTPQQFNAAHTQLMGQSVPNESLSSVVSFTDGELIRGTLLSGYIDGTNKDALERSRIPVLSEVDIYASQQLPSLTTGTRITSGAGAAVVAGANQNVNFRDVANTFAQNLNLSGMTAGQTIAAGETFVIAGVFERINAAGGYSYNGPNLQRFVVNTAATVAAGGTVTLNISPPMVVAGTNDSTGQSNTNSAFATVSNAPANGAALTFDGALSSTNLIRAAFHKRAISLVSARLPTPVTGESSFAVDPETGIAIRYWRGSDFATGVHGHRWDCVFGVSCTDQRLGVRINGNP